MDSIAAIHTHSLNNNLIGLNIMEIVGASAAGTAGLAPNSAVSRLARLAGAGRAGGRVQCTVAGGPAASQGYTAT